MRTPNTVQPQTNRNGFTPLSTTFPVVKPGMEDVAAARKPLAAGSGASATMMAELQSLLGGPPAAKRAKLAEHPPTPGRHLQVPPPAELTTLQATKDSLLVDDLLERGPGGAVDFSAFNASVRTQAPLASALAGVGFAKPAAPGKAGVPAASAAATAAPTPLPTFVDIMQRQGIASASGGLQQPNLAAELRSLDRTAVGSNSNAGGTAAAGAISRSTSNAAAAAVAKPDIQGCTDLPCDWSIKRSVTFVSPAPFTLCQSGVLSSTRPSCTARDYCHPAVSDMASPEERLHMALQSWRFPDAAWDGGAVAALSANRSTSHVLAQRLSAWRAALRSLYHAVRHGSCAAFYVVNPDGQRFPFTALFCAAGVRGGAPDVHAVISQSTRLLRSRLADRDLSFSPVAPGADAARDGTAASALLFSGGVAAHGLFDYLYNEVSFAKLLEETSDVPLLLAPVPFEGGCLFRQPLKAWGTTQVPGAGPGGTTATLPKAELAGGAVPHWTLQRLCAVLAESHGHDFEAFTDTDGSTLGLNWGVASGNTDGKDSEAAAAARPLAAAGGALSMKEMACWSQPQRQVGPRVIKSLAYSAGTKTYDIRTAS